MRVACVLLITAFVGMAQEGFVPTEPPAEQKTEMRLWKISAATLVGASVLDIASSYGRCCERNQLLASSDRTFGGRGVAVKSATLGAQLWLQYMVARKNPKLAKVLGFINFGGAGAMTAVAVRNFGIPQPPALR
jgi:hypothetical protein